MNKKRTTKWAAAATGLGVAVMALSIFGHKQVHAELVVPATPEQVWSVITDPAGYPGWNPVFVGVEGTYAEGAKMAYKLKDQSGKVSDVTAMVMRFEPGKELNQYGGLRGVLTFDHQWLLEPVEGGTRVIQHEEYRGIGVWFWDPSWFEGAYQRAIEGLKARLEG